MDNKKNCKACLKVFCKQCQWEASEEHIVQIRKGNLKTCPLCGWKPE